MKRLDSIKHRTLKDTISDLLRTTILSNNFPTEDYITEQELAEQLKVSRTPLREAMYDLINEDLIEFRPRKGYRVKYHEVEEVNQIFRIRRVIEREIVDELIQNTSPDDIQRLRDLVDEQERLMSEQPLEFIRKDKQFHRELFQISNLNFFLKSYDQFHNLTILIGYQAIRKQGRMKDVLQEHRDIIRMIEEKDRENLVIAIEYHLNETFNKYKEVLREQEQGQS